MAVLSFPEFVQALSVKTAEELSGGKADGMPLSDFDPKQVAMGKKVEREHTTDPAVAAEVAADHLEEIPDYYTRLGKMERDAKSSKEASVGFSREALIAALRQSRRREALLASRNQVAQYGGSTVVNDPEKRPELPPFPMLIRRRVNQG